MDRSQMSDGMVPGGPQTWRWRALCRWLYGSEALGPWRNRPRRRGLAIAFLGLLAAFPLVGWLSGEPWPVLVLLAPYATLSVLLAVATHGILERPLQRLDEREREQRRSVLREPYVTGASLGLVGGLVMAAALAAEDGLMMGTLLAVIGLLYGLPTVALALALPDDPLTDE